MPLCDTHLELARRYGMEPRKLLPADELELRLRETYAIDPLVYW